MKAKHVVLIFLLSSGLLLIGAQVRYRGLVNDIPVSQILFAIATFVLVRKRILKGKWTYLLLPFSVLFWEITAHLIDNIFSDFEGFNLISIGTPNMLFCMIGATYGALLASSSRLRMAGIVLLVFSAVCSAWYMTRGIDYWINYCNVGNFTGKVRGDKIENWQPVVNPSDTLPKSHYQDKLVVLDFWTVSCLACFKKFPLLDSLNKQYASDKRIVFEAVNLPDRYGDKKFETTLKLNGQYSFKTVFADTSAWRTFNIDGVPTIMVLKNDEIVFKGSIELAKDFLAENLK